MEVTAFYLLNTLKSKVKHSEINNNALHLGNISKNFTVNNMTKNRIKKIVKFFSVYFNPIDTNDILDIHKYLMKKS